MSDMETFNDYTYIYMDAHGRWNIATNPVFIAEHKNCKAIKKNDEKEIREYVPNYTRGS